MSTFIKWNKAIWFGIGWFLAFVMLQTVYMVFALVFKCITDTEYLYSLQQLFLIANSSRDDGALMQLYIDIIGGLTFYIELFLTVGLFGLFVIDREIHESRFSFNKIKISSLPIFITLGILMNILSTCFVSLFSSETLTSTGYNTDVLLQGSMIGILLSVGVLAPLCEELAFRYFMFHNLNRASGVLAIVLSSILFGFAHGNIIQGMYAFTFGIVFVMINMKCNSIWPGVIMHVTINSMSVFLLLFDTMQSQIIVMALMLIISLIPTLAIIINKSIKQEEIL